MRHWAKTLDMAYAVIFLVARLSVRDLTSKGSLMRVNSLSEKTVSIVKVFRFSFSYPSRLIKSLTQVLLKSLKALSMVSE